MLAPWTAAPAINVIQAQQNNMRICRTKMANRPRGSLTSIPHCDIIVMCMEFQRTTEESDSPEELPAVVEEVWTSGTEDTSIPLLVGLTGEGELCG